jgi:hypothetical protein
MRGFLATPKYFLDKSPRGIKYIEKYKSSKSNFHVAVSAAIADEWLYQPQLLRAISQVPGSYFKFYVSAHKLGKFCKKAVKTTPRIKNHVFVPAKREETDIVEEKFKELLRGFILKFDSSQQAVCPGHESVSD